MACTQVLLALRAAVSSVDAAHSNLIEKSMHPADVAAALANISADRAHVLLASFSFTYEPNSSAISNCACSTNLPAA